MDLVKAISYLKDIDFRNFIKYSLKEKIFYKTRSKDSSYISVDTLKYNGYNQEIIKLLDFRINDNEGASTLSQRCFEIDLASQKISFDIENPKWEVVFNDEEDTSSLHRFMWLNKLLVRLLDENVNLIEFKNDVFYLIGSWIDYHPSHKRKSQNSEIHQVYTVCERVVNWLISLSLVSPGNIVQDSKIYSAVVNQINYVIENLEYYGESFTSNHLLNNGRAIYIAGVLLNVETYKQSGRKIILTEIKRVIVDGGYLREGSTHYQFLINKNLNDVLFVAQMFDDDSDFKTTLTGVIKKISLASKSFIVSDGYKNKYVPYIGDISPDVEPSWIIEAPYVSDILIGTYRGGVNWDIAGYHSVFKELHTKQPHHDSERYHLTRESQNMINNSRDWGRINSDSWSVFTHVNNSSYPNNLTGHFHHDATGIIAYYKGECIITDCGRRSYLPNKRSLRDVSIVSHSGLRVDGLEPEMNMRTFYHNDFLDNYASAKPQILKYEAAEFKIYAGGYSRIKGINDVSRFVKITHGGLEIVDSIKGVGEHIVELYFHTEREVSHFEDDYIMLFSTNSLDTEKHSSMKINMFFQHDDLIILKGDDVNDFACASKCYGDHFPLTTITVKKKVTLPCELLTKIMIE